MMRIAATLRTLAVAAVLASTFYAGQAAPAVSPFSFAWQKNADATRGPDYPNGDKPIVVCPSVTGLTEADTGDGGGVFCETVAGPPKTLAFNGYGSSSIQKMHYAYASLGTGDFQITGCFEDDYAGSLENLAAIGIGVRNGTGNTDYFFQVFSPFSGSATIQVNYGTTNQAFTNVDGAPGLTRPRCGTVTYDRSENDLRAWASADLSAGSYTQVAQTAPAALASNPLGYAFGESKSPSATLQATITSFAIANAISSDVYTPSGGPDPPNPPNHSPVCSTIPNQSGKQGQSFTLALSGYCSDQDGDPLTYAATNLSSHGLTINPYSGLITGTLGSPATFNTQVTVVDDELAEAQATFQIQINPASGTTFHWTTNAAGTSNATYDCGSTTKAGDTVVIDGGSTANKRGNLIIANCQGTSTNPIIFTNDTSRTSALDLNGSATWGIHFQNSDHVVIDGTGKFSGASANGCGNSNNASGNKMLLPDLPRNCGIKITGNFQSAVKRKGLARFNTLKGIEVDGSSGVRSGFALNDHTYKLVGVTQAQCQANPSKAGCEWMEGWNVTDNYCHDTASECFYIGANANSAQIDDLPQRDNHIDGNLVINSGWDGISYKSGISESTGRSTMANNYVDGSGISESPSADGNSGSCMDIFEGGFVDIYGNVLRNCHGPGFLSSTNNRPASYGPATVEFFNNVIWKAGLSSSHGKDAVNFGRKSTAQIEIRPRNIVNNTIVEPAGNAIDVAGSISSCTVRDNIAAGTTAGKRTINAGQCTGAANANEQGTPSAQNFVDESIGDFHLTATSPACNDAAPTAPSPDFEGTQRPLDGAADRGADEAAACP